jgi:phenylalanyl-tRNA synthetase beta chain
MIDRGQPMHVFDYDKILGQKMVVRESSDGEVVTTLDGVARKLPAGVIVIEDGEGRLIDLCGIMGAKNSEVDEKTKRILLFVQVYDPVRIRKASMSLGHRTDAALRFEKGIDYGGVIPALWKSVGMISELSGAVVSSDLIDIINFERKQKEIRVNVKKINKISGVEIDKKEIEGILSSLGFVNSRPDYVKVPSWRYDDIAIPEDLAEEVVRLYGYYNLTPKLLEGQVPVTEKDETFYWEKVVKYFLKFMGFFECYTYSATTKQNVSDGAVRIANPLSDEMTHLKTSLLPQLLDVVTKNQGYSEKIKVFEIGTVYFNQEGAETSKVPLQPLRLGLITKGVEYNDLKGIVESLFYTMGLGLETAQRLLSIVDFGGGKLGLEIDFGYLVEKSSKSKSYIPITSFNSIKEDLTFEIPEGVLYPQIRKIIEEADKRVKKVEFKDIFDNYLTFSVEYIDTSRQVSSDDAQDIRKKIFKDLERVGVKLKI